MNPRAYIQVEGVGRLLFEYFLHLKFGDLSSRWGGVEFTVGVLRHDSNNKNASRKMQCSSCQEV